MTGQLGKTVVERGFNRLKICRHGPMLFNINDVYIGRSLDCYGEAHEAEVSLLMSAVKPGQTVLDIGANIGIVTVPLAQSVGAGGHVFAFEPQRVVFQTLCANVALNGLANVQCLNAAAGRRGGTAKVPTIDYGRQQNFGGISLEGVEAGESVRVVTVDALNLPRCDMMKVDVEGMELDVVLGARETIARCGPTIYVENNRKEHSAALIAALRGLGYSLYWHFPPLFNPRNHFEVAENVFGQTINVNMLGVPADSPLRVARFHRVQGPDDDWRAIIKRPYDVT